MNSELPIDYAASNGINCPECGSNNIFVVNTHTFDFCDNENGFGIVDYRCKECNSKFRCHTHFKYQITAVSNFKLLD